MQCSCGSGIVNAASRPFGVSLYYGAFLALSFLRGGFPAVIAMTKASSSAHRSSWPRIVGPPKDMEVVYWDDDNVLSVPSTMNYVDPSTTVISTSRDLAGSDSKLEGAVWLPTAVQVQNARGLAFSLDKNGFQLCQQKVTPLQIDFLDQNNVAERYYPKCEELVRSVLLGDEGNTNVMVKAFDHNVRSSSSPAEKGIIKGGGGATVQDPAGMVHADYTRVSAPRRIQDLSKPPKQNDVLRDRLGRDSLLDPAMVKEAIEDKRQYALINVWRNICPKGLPVQQMPLGCIDATTVSWADLRTFQIHYADRIGENYFCTSSTMQQAHQWCYFRKMTVDEALLLKQWDSHGGIAKGEDRDTLTSSFTVHSAFMDPTSPPNAPPRRSIEVRCVAIWDAE